MWCCLQTTDLSQPLNLDEQLLSYPEHGFEPDVGASLLQLLSSRSAPQVGLTIDLTLNGISDVLVALLCCVQ
eukprot:jgi/Chrzof1/14518/Cz09g05230.t1